MIEANFDQRNRVFVIFFSAFFSQWQRLERSLWRPNIRNDLAATANQMQRNEPWTCPRRRVSIDGKKKSWAAICFSSHFPLPRCAAFPRIDLVFLSFFFHPSAIYSQLIRSTSSNCKCLQRKKGNENQRNDPISSHGDYRPRRHIFHWKILSTMHHPFFFQSQQWIIPNQQSPIVIGQPVAKKGANGLRSFVRVDQASYKMDAIKPL